MRSPATGVRRRIPRALPGIVMVLLASLGLLIYLTVVPQVLVVNPSTAPTKLGQPTDSRQPAAVAYDSGCERQACRN